MPKWLLIAGIVLALALMLTTSVALWNTSYVKYWRIKPGMTVEQASAILGRDGTFVEDWFSDGEFQWRCGDGSLIVVTTMKGTVVSKEYVGRGAKRKPFVIDLCD